ncbi:MAG: TIGR03560 family F420-dependent LLM class oxidoreductase [Acidimicrobiales bacterium]
MQISFWANTGQSWGDLLDGCRHAEATGWDGIWVADHFMPQPGGYGPEDEVGLDAELEPLLEGWSLLAALAAAVPRVRLGAMVTGITYRHPAVLANMAATIDHVSGGRLVLGIGAGWQENEHRRYGIDLGTARERSDRFEEACAVLSGLLTEDRTTFDGRYYQLDGAPCSPKPIQSPLPILIGGGGEKRTLRTTARYAHEWNVWGTPEILTDKMAILDRHCAEVGRDPAEIRRSAAALLIFCDDEAHSDHLRNKMDNRGGLVGTVDQLRRRIDEYIDAGVDELVVPDFTMTVDNRAETLDRFRTEILDR